MATRTRAEMYPPVPPTKEFAYQILESASHRNGIGGAPFKVAIVWDEEEQREMLVVMFADKYYTAAFDLKLLQESNITFGENSFRGDRYDDALRPLLWETS